MNPEEQAPPTNDTSQEASSLPGQEQTPAPEPPVRDYQTPPAPERKPRLSKKRLLLVVVGVLLLAAIGFATAIFTSRSDEPQQDSVTQTPTPTTTTTEIVGDIPDTTQTKTLKTDFPRIEFTYPETWTVTTSSENEDIKIESPEFQYTTASGGNVTGNFRVYIRQGARQEDSNYIGRGIASQDSEILPYADPAVGQRPETNLSFFGIDTADNFAYFMIAGNFSLKIGESLGPEYGREPDTYIVAGGYSSKELTDDMATNPVTTEYFSQTNAYKQAITIVKSLKLY